MKEGRSIAGYYCCSVCVCVIGSFSQCSCSVSLNLSDGHWEAFIKFHFVVFIETFSSVKAYSGVPQMLVVLQSSMLQSFPPVSPVCDCFVFFMSDTDISDQKYGSPKMLVLKWNR